MHSVKWEFRTIDAGDEASLRNLGDEGWELVSAHAGTWILKRQAIDFRDRVTMDQRRRYFAQWDIDIDAVDGMGSR